MSKVKMRCITCGKWFQSANAKEVTCPDCTQKARKEKMASKNAPPASSRPGGTTDQAHRPAVPPPPKPKPVQSGTAHWLDTLQDVKVGEPDKPPPPRPKPPASPAPRDDRSGPGGYRPAGPGAYREGGSREDREHASNGNQEGGYRGPGAYREDRDRGPGGYRVGGGSGLPGSTFGQRPRQPMEGGPGYASRPDRPRPTGPREGGPGGQKPRGKGKPGVHKPAAPPKPKREKIPPPQPFAPTPEQVTQVEERYIELSTPTEFDGIRTRIAQELGVPKKAVKKIVKELRDRQDIPSWWELQTYKGSPEELESIKNAYLPLLPVPSVGVHKEIAEQLDLKAGIVYQAIKAIRLEMNLPQYNDPSLHGPDFVLHPKKKPREQAEQPAEVTPEIQAEQSAEVTPATQAEQPAEAVPATTEQSAEVTPATQAEQPAEAVPATQTEAALKDVEAATSTPEHTNADSDAVPVSEGSVSSEA